MRHSSFVSPEIPEGFFDIDESDQEYVNNASDSNDDETIKSESDIEDDPSLDNEERSGDVENTKKRPYDGGMEPVSKKKNKKNKQLDPKLYKPPTVKELNQLRETENLFNSNLFRLQLSDQGWLQSMNVKMPMKQQPFGGKGSFQFIKPSAVSIIGSFASNCCVGPDVCVDLAVEMPQALHNARDFTPESAKRSAEQCFQQSDHLNERYLRKRALYLCHLAGTLHSCHLVQSASFRLCQGDPSRPVLEVRPAGKLGKRVVVALRPVPQSGVFKLARFSPEKNNVRPSWFFTTSDAIEEPYPPTPHHNHSTIQDLVSTANQEYCRLALEGHSNIKDGIRLLKVWLTQRKLNKGYGSFDGHIVAQLVSHLVIQKRISVLGSSYQVVRATWVYLAQSDWTNFGVSLAEPSRGTPPVSEFHQHFEVVLVDSTGYCNLCANMSKETYERVKREADLAVRCLDNPNINSFQVLFMTSVPFYRQYDHIVRVSRLSHLETDQVRQLDHMNHTLPLAQVPILATLREGLGRRVTAIAVSLEDTPHWSISIEPPASADSFTVGLTLDPVHAFINIDKGPTANTEEAEKFRDFWGPKSELRRFQDISICEAVVWRVTTLADKRLVCGQVVEYLLVSRLGLKVTYVADQYETLIKHNKVRAHFLNSSYEYETLIKHSKVHAHFQNSSYEYETLIKHSKVHAHFQNSSYEYETLIKHSKLRAHFQNSSYEYETLIKHSKVRAHFQNGSYEYETLIKHSKVKPVDFEYGTGEEATLAVLSVFNELSKQVRELNALPLEIISVQGTSPVFRYTDTFPPLAAQSRPGKKVTKDGPTCILLNDTSAIGMAPRWVPAIEAVIQLALSKKWPNDLEAVRRIKAAFHIEVAKCLSQQCGLTAQPYPNFVDVLKSGFVFRLRLAYPREVGLLKKHVTPHGVTTFVDTDESRDLEKDIVHIPTITGAVHGLHQEHPSYGPACCLSKRWLAAQMIDPHHFPEIVVELLVAWLYLCPEPHEPPTQPQTAFFRFLHLLASTNWVTQPVILNFNTELTREEVVEIESMFQSSRSTLPPLFLATSYQPSGVVWTKRNPTLQVLIRTAMLAKESLTIVEEKLFSRHFDTKVIFRPPLDVYDVLIYLRPLLNPRRLEAVDVNKDQPLVNLPPYQYQQGEKLPVVGFNPVQYYLQELRETYGEFALFFHDPYGGEVVGVLWIPAAMEVLDFKVSALMTCIDCSVVVLDGNAIFTGGREILKMTL
uniref:Nucleolar protein 6 n=1 Tax=Timema monikensis TaxID=170555 RepID=A0A7R9DZX1_9NEOP|nr:unnamed protein product [Timema monikensis]